MRNVARLPTALALALILAGGASADTVYMKNGSVIRGNVIGYADGVFTVELDGARSRAVLAADEIDRIDFEGQSSAVRTEPSPVTAPTSSAVPPRTTSSTPPKVKPAEPKTAATARDLDVIVEARADWTDTTLRVNTGDRVRITASGTVKLDRAGLSTATPDGINRPDRDKLLPTRATGALIAVIGDDNDDFLFVGAGTEFEAMRTGTLYLGINEGVLADNSGAFRAHVTLEPATGGGSRSGGLSGRTPSAVASSKPAAVTSGTDRPAGAPASTADSSDQAVVVVPANVDWTNTRLSVNPGDVVRVTASGRVNLDRVGKRTSGPEGIEAVDADKLMADRPTGGLIAVVGDDNDDFAFVGAAGEFRATHRGTVFLSVNEGVLADNSGVFNAIVSIDRNPPVVSAAKPATAPATRPSGPTPASSTPAVVPAATNSVTRTAAVMVQGNIDWTNTQLRVQRGNTIRISATGRVQLDRAGRSAGPEGLPSPDTNKLMADRPTGGLIAVVGDDNDDFEFVGASGQFVARHDGMLFLSVNEGMLRDNAGAFSCQVTIESAVATTASSRPAASTTPSTSASRPSLPAPVVDEAKGGPPPVSPAKVGIAGGEIELSIPARGDWTATDLVLRKGSRVRITATGTIQLDAGGRSSGPGGLADSTGSPRLLADKPLGGLIAVVGDDSTDYVFIGAAGELQVPRDGMLFLGVNDNELFDNSGVFTVRILVTLPGR